MRRCEIDFPIPKELKGEDVYNTIFIFNNEEEAIDYVVKTYDTNKANLIAELYDDEEMRKKYGKEHFLRSASVKGSDIILSELMSGEYVLWTAY